LTASSAGKFLSTNGKFLQTSGRFNLAGDFAADWKSTASESSFRAARLKMVVC
jgi:hypothetical protein